MNRHKPIPLGLQVAAVILISSFVTLFVVVTMDSQHQRERRNWQTENAWLEHRVQQLELECDDLRRRLNRR